MMKPVPGQTKWLAGLIIVVVATLLVGCAPANQAPVISSLSPSDKEIRRSDTIEVKSVASDPDGDELSYTWSASSGNISGEGPVVFWTAPGTLGDYTITVKVIDGRGGEATESVSIEVVKSG